MWDREYLARNLSLRKLAMSRNESTIHSSCMNFDAMIYPSVERCWWETLLLARGRKSASETIHCGRQGGPANLISTFVQTHARQFYSLALTRFCWNLESFTTNAWNAKNAIFSRASRVTFGPWITWWSCIAAAPTNPNRACQLGFDLSVHVVALYVPRVATVRPLLPTYPIEQFGNRTQSNTNRSIAELNRT